MKLVASSNLSKLNCVIEGTESKGSLYFSNIITALDKSLIFGKKIKAIITIAKGYYLPYTKKQIPNYLYISIEDKSTTNISQYFEKCSSFIQKNLSKTNVLVHCKAGLSRSVSIIISFLIMKKNYTFKKAYSLLKSCEPKVKPNKSFIHQLEKLQSQNREYNNLGEEEQSENKSFDKDLEERKAGLFLIAKTLENQNKQIEAHIGKIKQLCQQNSLRIRSKSQFLRSKIKEAKQKREKKDFLFNFSNYK